MKARIIIIIINILLIYEYKQYIHIYIMIYFNLLYENQKIKKKIKLN